MSIHTDAACVAGPAGRRAAASGRAAIRPRTHFEEERAVSA